jgi:hypothetical protein
VTKITTGFAALAIAIAPISVGPEAHAGGYKTACTGLTGNAFATCTACQLGSQAACAAMGTGGPANAPAPAPVPQPLGPPPVPGQPDYLPSMPAEMPTPAAPPPAAPPAHQTPCGPTDYIAGAQGLCGPNRPPPQSP